MIRFFIVLILLSQTVFASNMSSANSVKPTPFMTCLELGIHPQVEIKIYSLYDKTAVRVEIREKQESGNEIVFLNDLWVQPEHAQGIYQNALFHLSVGPAQGLHRQHSAHIDLLSESGIRSSAELMCHSIETL